MLERKVSEHTCIAVCCILGCMAADSPKAVTMDMWASELEQWNKVAWSDESSFLSHYVDGQVPVCHWRTHGTRMHYGKAASQWMQCDALGDVLLENLGSCYSYGCCFETFHLPKPCCRPFIPLIETIFLNGGGIYTLQKWFRTDLKSTTKNYVTTITSVTNVLTLIKCFMQAKNTHCWLLVLHRQSPGWKSCACLTWPPITNLLLILYTTSPHFLFCSSHNYYSHKRMTSTKNGLKQTV